MSARGTVYLVGAGPGAADLLTLRAARLLEAADIVFYDALVGADIVALARRARLVAVGKRCGKHQAAQKFINKQLVEASAHHAIVVRLKGGDPTLFGRANEEIDALAAAGVPYEIVPGVTSALAASAALGVSLTERGVARSVTFATPRVGSGERNTDWLRAGSAAETLVLYMAAGEADAVATALIAAGRPARTPAAIIENASGADERTVRGTLGELPALVATLRGGPALVVIGEVVRVRTVAAKSPADIEPRSASR